MSLLEDAVSGAPHARFVALVTQRAELGQARYGERHLTGPSLLDALVTECADAFNYAVMETARLHPLQAPAIQGPLEALTSRLGVFGRLVCDVAVDLGADPVDFTALCRAQLGHVGARQYGNDAYLTRQNLPEALEELADARVMVDLELDRRATTGEGDLPTDHALVALGVVIEVMGAAVASVHDHIAHAPRSTAAALAA